MSMRDDFTKAGGRLLGTGYDDLVLPRSGYNKESAFEQFSVKLDEHSNSAEAVRLTPNALKNLAKEQSNTPGGKIQRGRVDYN